MKHDEMQDYAHLYDGLRNGTINRDHYTMQDLKDICGLFEENITLAMPKDHENRDQATYQDTLNGVMLTAARVLSDGVFEEKPDATLEEWGTFMRRMSDVFKEQCVQYIDDASDATLDFVALRQRLEAITKMDVAAQEENFHRRFGPKSKR